MIQFWYQIKSIFCKALHTSYALHMDVNIMYVIISTHPTYLYSIKHFSLKKTHLFFCSISQQQYFIRCERRDKASEKINKNKIYIKIIIWSEYKQFQEKYHAESVIFYLFSEKNIPLIKTVQIPINFLENAKKINKIALIVVFFLKQYRLSIYIKCDIFTAPYYRVWVESSQ